MNAEASNVTKLPTKRARPNWGTVIAHETTIATLRAELSAVLARAWKWQVFVGVVAFVVGAVAGRAFA